MREAATLSTILTDVGSIVTAAASWLQSAVSTVMAEPVLEFFLLVSFCGIGIGLFKRMTRI